MIDRRQYLRASGVAAATGITGLAGCTGGGGGGSEVYTIGATIPKTGVFSSLGRDLKRGYEMGVERMNNNGGVQGRQVELIIEDDESDPRVVREKLNQILSNNDVDMLWGTFAGVLNLAAAAVAEQEGVPFLEIASSGDKVHKAKSYEWTFTPFPLSSDHAASTKDTLGLIPESERPSDVAIWAPNTNWSIEMANYWEQTLSAAGYNIVLRQKHQLHSKDFSTLISATQSAGAEVILDTPAPDGGITAMQQLNNSDYTPKFIQFTRAADTRSWWSALGEAGENVVMSPGWVPGLTGNGNEQMVQTYHENYEIGSGELLPVMVGASYNLTQTAEQAVNAASSTERSAVRDSLRNNTFQTVTGKFGFDEYGRPTNLVAPMGQWINGDQHLVYPKTDGEAYRELVYPM
ncbi:MAG: amino acid ABC transporter substrate-binding protein [Haloquadratum sp.]